MRAFVRLGEDVVGALDELELDAVAAFIGMFLCVVHGVGQSVGRCRLGDGASVLELHD